MSSIKFVLALIMCISATAAHARWLSTVISTDGETHYFLAPTEEEVLFQTQSFCDKEPNKWETTPCEYATHEYISAPMYNHFAYVKCSGVYNFYREEYFMGAASMYESDNAKAIAIEDALASASDATYDERKCKVVLEDTLTNVLDTVPIKEVVGIENMRWNGVAMSLYKPFGVITRDAPTIDDARQSIRLCDSKFGNCLNSTVYRSNWHVTVMRCEYKDYPHPINFFGLSSESTLDSAADAERKARFGGFPVESNCRFLFSE